MYRRVVLTGFMGAGKSTVGRLLAKHLGWLFWDSDRLLTERFGRSIAELFRDHGEVRFRHLEAALIAELLAENPQAVGGCAPEAGRPAVIALGGGALEHADTRAALAASEGSLLVYLEVPLAISLARCEAEPGAALRPVLADRQLLENRFAARLPLYQAAHLTVATAELSPEQVAASIAAAIERTA